MQRITSVAFVLLSILIATSLHVVAQDDDFGNTPSPFEATLLAVPATSLQGNIETPGDVDCFMFQATQATTYTLSTTQLGEGLDTLLVLFDRNGKTVLAVDDNGGGGRDSKLVWRAPFSALYFVCVRNVRTTQGVGSYTLSVVAETSSSSATPAQATEPNNAVPAPTNDGATAPQPTPPEDNATEPVTPTQARAAATPASIVKEGRIALLGATDAASLDNVRGYLDGTGVFPAIETIDVSQTTPSASELNRFEALLVWADSGFQDAEGLGDRLADYIDRGGGVVVAAVSFDRPDPLDPDTLGGRFLAGGYYVIAPEVDNVSDGRLVLGSVSDPQHPVMRGVSEVDGGPRSLHSPTSGVTPGGKVVASWDNGDVLAAVKTVGQAHRVDINLFPPSSLLDPDLWPFTPDNDVPRLMANALLWASGREQPFSRAPQDEPARLNVSPLSLSFSTREGDPSERSLQLSNEGAQPFNWSATVDARWVTLKLSGGTLQPGASQPLVVVVDGAALPPGTHSATLTISTPGTQTSLTRVPITLIVETSALTNAPPETSNGPGNVLSVPAAFPSLAAALSQAQDGDTLELAAGTYANVALTLSVAVTIRGDQVRLTGNGQAPVISVGQSAGGVTLKGITLSGGSEGLHVTDGATLTLEQVTVEDNVGWGVRLSGAARVNATNSVIRNNGSGGITIGAGATGNKTSQVALDDNVIENNKGCGVHVASSQAGIQVTGSENRVSNNDFNLCDNGKKLPQGFLHSDNSAASEPPSSPLAFDGDKDGVPDANDFCPVTPGRVDNNGCP